MRPIWALLDRYGEVSRWGLGHDATCVGTGVLGSCAAETRLCYLSGRSGQEMGRQAQAQYQQQPINWGGQRQPVKHYGEGSTPAMKSSSSTATPGSTGSLPRTISAAESR